MESAPKGPRVTLLVEQLESTLSLLPMLEKARAELSIQLNESTEKAKPFLMPGLAWADLHEHPIAVQMAIYFEVTGLTEYMASVSKAEDPFSELMKLDAHPDYQDWNGGTDQKYGPQHLLGVLLALLGSIESLVLYGYYISELLVQFREGGNDDALFKAIRVDPTIVGAKVVRHRLARAAATNETLFFAKLLAALKGKSGKQARYLSKFRFLMQVLAEQGQGELPTAEVRSLAIRLVTYADNPNAERNLDELIRTFRKNKTI